MRTVIDEGTAYEYDEAEPEGAGSCVVLKAAATVFIGLCDSERSTTSNDKIALEKDSKFRVLWNKPTSAWIDVVVPCYGYCSVSRGAVQEVIGFQQLPGSSVQVYTGNVEALKLHFQEASSIELFLPLVRFLGSHLTELGITASVSKPVLSAESAALILQWCPNLVTLTVSGATAEVMDTLLQAYQENRCRISKLMIAKLASRPTVINFLRELQDPTTNAAKRLKSLTLRVGGADAATAAAFKSMLGGNRELEFLVLAVLPSQVTLFQPHFQFFERQPMPLSLGNDVKVAFLSAVSRIGYLGKRDDGSAAPTLRSACAVPCQNDEERRESIHARLNQDVLVHIFQYAANKKHREIMCVEAGG